MGLPPVSSVERGSSLPGVLWLFVLLPCCCHSHACLLAAWMDPGAKPKKGNAMPQGASCVDDS